MSFKLTICIDELLFNTWHDEHIKNCCPKDGWEINLNIKSTGIGNRIIATCPICGEQKDITNYLDW
jgi:hypothetical protein